MAPHYVPGYQPKTTSDGARQSFTDKAGAALKPDSQKGMLESGGDMLKGKADSAAGGVQPEGSKTFAQQASDAVTGAGSTAGDLVNSAANTLGGMLGGAGGAQNNAQQKANETK